METRVGKAGSSSSMARHPENEEIQEQLREKHGGNIRIRLPVLPEEIIREILLYIPSENIIEYGEGWKSVSVDGLLPYAVLDPSLLNPHYKNQFSDLWTLNDIAGQPLKKTVLGESLLTKHIKLSVEYRYSDDSPSEALLDTPHQWKKLGFRGTGLRMDEFISLFQPCLPRLEALSIFAKSITFTSNIQLQSTSLKTVGLQFFMLPTFYASGLLHYVTHLRLDLLTVGFFLDRDTFRSTVDSFPHMLSELPFLIDLAISSFVCDSYHLVSLPKIESTSLRYLYVFGRPASNIALLALFSNCCIECIKVGEESMYLRDAEAFFPNLRHIRLMVS